MDKRLITPAEATLLLAPSSRTASRCLQAGLMSLLGAGRIAVEPSESVFRGPALLLRPTPAADALPLPGHLAALEQALASYRSGTRLTRSEVLHALQKRFGYGFGRYVQDEVAPGLIKRGMLERVDDRWLGLFPRIRYRRSPRGEALAAPLERLMAAVETVPSLIETDPRQALRLARSAGVLLVMSPEARRMLPALRKVSAERGEDAAPLAYMPIESERENEWDQVLELGDMALEFDLDTLFDGLDAMADLTSGADSSSADGGDGGGGGD